MFDPLVSFFRALPPMALIPLVIVYLGIGEQARLSILVYAAFFSSVVVIYEGVAAIDDIYVRAAALARRLRARAVPPGRGPRWPCRRSSSPSGSRSASAGRRSWPPS